MFKCPLLHNGPNIIFDLFIVAHTKTISLVFSYPYTFFIESLYYSGIYKTPWSSSHEHPAPAPEWVKASWYAFDNGDSNAIALNLTWSQSGKLYLYGKIYFHAFGVIIAHFY